MMIDTEKVCLTAGQIENIGKAYAKEIEGKQVKDVCPKASKWVKGFFGKKRKKREKEPEEIVEDAIVSRIKRKIGAKLDELF